MFMTTKTLQSAIVKARESGITTLSQVQIMLSILVNPGQTINSIATAEGIDVDAVRKAIDKMESLKLVATKRTRGDRGYIRLCKLTAKGKRVVDGF